MKYILKDEEKFYISEGKATLTLNKATQFDSLESIFKIVPIMRDWNWDYKIFSIEDDKLILIDEIFWSVIYNKTKKDGELYEQNNKVIPAFLRSTEN
jgi:hypothetical protein